MVEFSRVPEYLYGLTPPKIHLPDTYGGLAARAQGMGCGFRVIPSDLGYPIPEARAQARNWGLGSLVLG